MYEIIKQFLNEGGKCLLIEDGKPIGVVLTMEEYELLRSKSPAYAEASAGRQISNLSPAKVSERNLGGQESQKEETIFEKNPEPVAMESITKNPIPTLRSEVGGRDPDQSVGIGVAMVEEMNFREASAELADINFADAGDVTLEDLGLDELPY